MDTEARIKSPADIFDAAMSAAIDKYLARLDAITAAQALQSDLKKGGFPVTEVSNKENRRLMEEARAESAALLKTAENERTKALAALKNAAALLADRNRLLSAIDETALRGIVVQLRDFEIADDTAQVSMPNANLQSPQAGVLADAVELFVQQAEASLRAGADLHDEIERAVA